jgi:hypothetical protein
MCLAFVPISDITKAFLIIKIRSPDTFMPVLDYFEQYYIGNLKKGSRSVRELPMFPPSMWNCFDRILNNLSLTNNNLEALHKNFEVFFLNIYSNINLY